jgi:alkylated DNA repair protein alkB homolog 6
MDSSGAIDFMQLLRKERQNARSSALPKKKDESEESRNVLKAASGESRDGEPAEVIKWDASINIDTQPYSQIRDLSAYCICQEPSSIYYIDKFISDCFCEALTNYLKSLPVRQDTNIATHHNNSPVSEDEETKSALGRWTMLKHAQRKVALFDSRLQAFPEPLRIIAQALYDCNIFTSQPPNHILINDYESQQGILAHTDGPAYESRTATVSLGGDVLLWFTPRPGVLEETDRPGLDPIFLSGQGSLVVFTDSAYLDYMHSIHDRVSREYVPVQLLNASSGAPQAGSAIHRKSRISLTFRIKK